MGIVSDIYKGFTLGEEGTPARTSSKSYGVYITGEGVYDMPKRDVELITIPGRNGTLIKDKGRFNNIQLTYHCGMFGDDQTDFASNFASFRERLANYTVNGYQFLYDDYNPDTFRKATYIGGLEVNPVAYGQAGNFDIEFECKPQRFLKSGNSYKEMSPSPWFINPTKWESSPVIRFQMTGTSGTIDFYAETFRTTQTITINGAPQNTQIFIDCELGEAYTGSFGVPSESMNQYVSLGTRLPVLKRGTTRVTFSSTVSNLYIKPRWWTL